MPCSPLFYPLEAGLRKCYGTRVAIGQNNDNIIRTVVHELAHVYTLVNGVTSDPGPVAVAHMYFYSLGLPGEVFCHPRELYADIMSRAVIGHPGVHRYWASCPGTTDGIAEDALTVVRSAVAGTMPSWFSTAYDTGEGDPDLERLWADIRTVLLESDRSAIVFQLRDAFGGYCDNAKATASAFANGVTRNPWRDGGCTPKAPGSLAVTPSGAGKITVTWSAPTDDGGSPIRGYKVQWKSGSQDFDVSRQASVNDPARLQYLIAALSDGVAYTVQILAWNHNGDGDSSAEATATAMATDSTAPVLLTSRVDRSTLGLTWNEALDVSSQPDVSDFAVSVGGNNRAITGISVSDNAVTLTLSSAAGVGQAVMVAYTVPTGEDASPLRDTASNNAPGFSAQMARNDTTSAAITSDPGADMTYAAGDAYYRRDVIELGVTFGEPVKVAGSPELKFDIGSDEKKARYVGGSGTTTLTFRYTVAEGDLAANGLSIPTGVLSGNGTVRYTVDSTWAPSYVALDPQDGHKVNGIRPTIVSATGRAGGTTLTLIWDKTLDENAVPPTIRPRVLYLRDMATDTDRSGDITNISVSGSEVTLTLDTALLSDDELEVSYYRATHSAAFPDASPVRDIIGNWAANSSALVVIRPANEKPTFSEGASAARSVVEGTAAEMDIGAPVTAVDPDADTLTYSLGGTDASTFDLVTSSGQLRTKATLDANSKKTYTVTISVHDGKNADENPDTTVDDKITVTITVTSTNTSLSDLTLSEGWLDPAFVNSTLNYTTSVGYTAMSVTVMPVTEESGATVAFLDGNNNPLADADIETNEYEVDLNLGENVFKIEVTSESETVTRIYAIKVTRTEKDTSLTPQASDPVAPSASKATYTIKFQGDWTAAATPDGVPGGAHYSRLVAAVHDAGVTFLRSGEAATAGIESMAETGGTSVLRSEVTRAGTHALGVVQGDTNSIGPTDMESLTVTLTTDHPLVTLVTMIAPSPDWFVGVSGLSLLDIGGNWLSSHEVQLYPWDAGTENGDEFSLSNPATSPRGVITSIRGTGKFSTESIATLTFTLESVNFTPTGAPFITGPPEVGEELTAHTSAIDDRNGLPSPGYSYQWLRVDSGGQAVNISGATSDTYTVQAADAGKRLAVRVGFTDDDNNRETLTSDATEVVIVAQVTVSFEATAYQAAEGGQGATIGVVLDKDPHRPLRIPLRATPGGGAVPTDYSAPSMVTFGAGETERDAPVSAHDDSVDDDGESITLSFAELPDGVSAGSPSETLVQIVDNDYVPVTLGWEETAFTAEEPTSPGTLTPVTLRAVAVTATDKRPESDFSFDFTVNTANGTARQPDDYERLSETATFDRNDFFRTTVDGQFRWIASADFTVNVEHDTVDEPSEQFHRQAGFRRAPGSRTSPWAIRRPR